MGGAGAVLVGKGLVGSWTLCKSTDPLCRNGAAPLHGSVEVRVASAVAFVQVQKEEPRGRRRLAGQAGRKRIRRRHESRRSANLLGRGAPGVAGRLTGRVLRRVGALPRGEAARGHQHDAAPVGLDVGLGLPGLRVLVAVLVEVALDDRADPGLAAGQPDRVDAHALGGLDEVLRLHALRADLVQPALEEVAAVAGDLEEVREDLALHVVGVVRALQGLQVNGHPLAVAGRAVLDDLHRVVPDGEGASAVPALVLGRVEGDDALDVRFGSLAVLLVCCHFDSPLGKEASPAGAAGF